MLYTNYLDLILSYLRRQGITETKFLGQVRGNPTIKVFHGELQVISIKRQEIHFPCFVGLLEAE
jgi:hypothetical protein